MNNKRLATVLIILIIQNLFGPSIGQSYRGRGRGRGRGRDHHHHHHHDDYRGGGGGSLLGGLGAVLGIAGAGLIAGAVARGATRGFGGGGYPTPYVQPALPVAYAGTGYTDPYLPDGFGSQFAGGLSYPIVGGAGYGGGYLAPVSSRVTTVSDRLYSNIY